MTDNFIPSRQTLGEILAVPSLPIRVPEWQRDYSWDTTQVEAFWYDLKSFSDQYPGDTINDHEYFLGSVVFVATGTHKLVLDDQQRLATATILLSVIARFLRRYKPDAGLRTEQTYIAAINDATEETDFRLTLNRYDATFFRREIQEAGDSPDPQYESHRLIRKARTFFERQFEETYNSVADEREAFEWALRIQMVVTSFLSVVVVTSNDEDSASAAFETLNDRGIGLSTPDLLRNLLLRRALEADRDEIIESWKDVLALDEDSSVDAFLRHYWISKHGDVKARRLYREMKDAITGEDLSSLDFSRELQQDAVIYRELSAGRDDDIETQKMLGAIRALGANALMPALLACYSGGTPDERRLLVKCLVSLYVRHSTIGKLENSRLESEVYEIAKHLRENHDFGYAIERIKEFAPSDEAFSAQFAEAQVTRQASARHVLEQLELAQRTPELEVAPPIQVHLEHIYPKTPEAGNRWANHQTAVNRLGNLTLLAARLNTAARNKPFGDKKAHYEMSDLFLTKELLEYESWDMEAINRRQERWSVIASGIWNFPD